jgi:transducin (beta)-like 1
MVYSVAFSPNGEFVASGAHDRAVYIWSVRDGSLVRTFTGPAGVFEVSWSARGDKLAACFNNSHVAVLDVRM